MVSSVERESPKEWVYLDAWVLFSIVRELTQAWGQL